MPPSYEEANAGCPGYYYGDGNFSWDDMFIRRVFIRKVYSILMLQLFSTVAVIALFTFYLLFLVTYISLACCGDLSFYNTKSVVLCIGITATVCLCVTIFSFQSKVPWLHAVYASIGAVVFTMLLMGNKQYAISPEEYIFATLSLYLDIVYLFTFLLQLFGNGRE
ncbi:lifeguard 2-like protein [Labeo rohita]|uniref:Protein lifeguard 2 n=1 Tax=Labeo rohita TaxID=84645 RepID=A0A498NJ98_LABRO|nr:lifeguard 2-like protein [Labeo rohita]